MALAPVKNRPAVAPTQSATTPEAPTPEANGWVSELKTRFTQDINALGFTAYAKLNPPPVLKRPVVMIPGLTMHAKSYDPLARNLSTEKQNGPVAVYVAATKQFHYGGVDGRVMNAAEVKDAKIFQLEYKNAKAPSTQKALEISDMLDAVAAATGKSDLDVVTHSAGGDDFRQYLDTRTQQDVHIGKLVMIGPVTHGTIMGNIGSVAGGLIGVKDAADELGFGDALPKHLDETWDKQQAQIAEGVSIIAIASAPTIGEDGSVKMGDGFTQANAKAASLPGATLTILKGVDPTPLAHLREVGYSGVVDEVQRLLGQ